MKDEIMKLRPAALAFAFLPLLALGCRDTTEPGEPVTVARFVELSDSARTTKLAECYPAYSRYYFDSELATEVALLEKGSAAGRLVFHEEAVEACIQAILKLSCRQYSGHQVIAACDQAFEPRVAPGGECYSDEECVGGWCSHDGCPGTCVAYAQLGESCVEARCDPATGYCGRSDDTCHSLEDENGNCESSSWCLEGLVCYEGSCIAPDYIPLAGLGEGCGDCAQGLYCASLASGLFPGECESLPAPEEGAECGPETACGEGMICVGATLRCVPWAELGESCAGADPRYVEWTGCKIGLRCVEGRCEQLPVVGPCEGRNSCRRSTSYCSNEGQCVPLKAAGESCGSYDECASGRCEGACIAECIP